MFSGFPITNTELNVDENSQFLIHSRTWYLNNFIKEVSVILNNFDYTEWEMND